MRQTGQAFSCERVMEAADFGNELREVIDQAGNGCLALLANSHDGEFEHDCAEDFVAVI